MTAECPACTAAAANRWCGAYRSGCLECSARLISQSPAYHEAASSGSITPRYRDALQAAFGAAWKDGHERVKGWAA